ncbi:MAG: DUF2254 domain-containing protein [Myxococcales bacterium]|nr:DUF2254 domain-containing protein [Myxococcales bacterium]
MERVGASLANTTGARLEDNGHGPELLGGTGRTLFLLVVGTACGLLTLLLILDVGLLGLRPAALWGAVRGDAMLEALYSLAEVLTAVLGLSLTVVAIVVQLASQRYSAKIVDLFMQDPVNGGTFGFMAVSCVYVVILPTMVTSESIPHVAVGAGLLLTVINFGLLLPYFRYVFAFLQPENIITAIERSAVRALETARASRQGREGGDVARARRQVAAAVERIADNCLAAIGQQDRNLALHSVKTLEGFVRRFHSVKQELPDEWPQVEADAFASLSAAFYKEIVEQRVWVEAKALMEYEHVLRRALGDMNELVTQIAASTRLIGVSALRHGELEVVELAIRFFNTYIRHALNAGNVRAIYNILDQYRRMTSALLKDHPALCQRIVEHFVYYGQTANARGLPFVTVTVAHDVRFLCEEAFADARVRVEPLLDRFLSLDQQPEGETSDIALLGVRKAQSILGAYFLQRGADDLVQRIRLDMRDEQPDRLLRIRDSILAVRERKFWEITDRGFNFDYVEPARRQFVTEFFQPFELEGAKGKNPLGR